MNQILTLLAFKIAALFGAMIGVVGILTFFYFESLQSYRWWLVGVGGVLTLVPELLSRSVLRKLSAPAGIRTE